MSVESPSIAPEAAPAAAAAIFNPPAHPAAPPVAAPQAAPLAPAAPVAPPLVPSSPETVTLTMQEVRRLLAAQDQLATIEGQRAQAAREAEEAKAVHMAKQGEWQRGFDKLKADKEVEIQAERNRAALLESQTKKWVLDREMTVALADQELVPGANAQLTQLWRDRFVVKPEGDRFTVQNPETFQTVGDFIKTQLSLPEYRHFLRAHNTIGGIHDGPTSAAVAPPPAKPAAPPEPQNMGQAAIQYMQGIQKLQGDPRANMNMGMGLKAIH